jgi:dihydroflavonol-4-reductase
MPGGTNLLDVRDVAAGIIKTLRASPKNGDYLLSGENMMFAQSNRIIAEALSVNPPSRVLPRFLNLPLFYLFLIIESLSKNKAELTADAIDSGFKFRYFDNSKAGKELNWRPEIDFKRTISETIDWLEKNDFFEK